jgi:hypothetical protein
MAKSTLALALLFLTGCPPAGAPTGGGGTTGAVGTTGIVRQPREHPILTEKPSADPVWKEDADFPRARIAELYRAEQLAPETDAKAALEKAGLVKGDGKPSDRAAAYERALKRWASERPDEWAALVQEIAEARAKAVASSGVEKH